MTIPNKDSYTHGSTGAEPATPRDYDNGDPLDAENFDYYLYTTITQINAIIDALNAIDSDNDEQVDAADHADSATDATNVTGSYKGNDIDNDGDGVVNKSDKTRGLETRTSDPNSPSDGQVWLRTDL